VLTVGANSTPQQCAQIKQHRKNSGHLSTCKRQTNAYLATNSSISTLSKLARSWSRGSTCDTNRPLS
jgi:hypothetical protein